MEWDLQPLQDRVERLLSGLDRLVEENQRLKAELSAAHAAHHQMEQRMHEARLRVESALSRLPGDLGTAAQGQP